MNENKRELDPLFARGDARNIWLKYCGFLDLTVSEFRGLQEEMMRSQLEALHQSQMGRRLLGERPLTVDEFRRKVSLTTYADYQEAFSARDEGVLVEKPYCWARSSGRGGNPKWIPFTAAFVDINVLYSITTSLLACAEARGDVRVGKGVRILQSLPSKPYGAAYYAEAAAQQLGARLIPDLKMVDELEFIERVKKGFAVALRSGVDVLASLSSVLVKMGEQFTDSSQGMKLSWKMLQPRVLWHLVKGVMISKMQGRGVLPKDLWPLKGLIAYGTDTEIYEDKILEYWGKRPLQIYVATEVGLIGTQAWNKRHMSFTPASCFLEFIPESEWEKGQEDRSYQPRTVTIDELKVGGMYEVVVSSFHGMPFVRYRLGDLIRVVSMEDEEAGIKTPQFVFYTRAGDLIDMAGFARLDEKSFWQALVATGIHFVDWTVRKESESGRTWLHLFIELKEDVGEQEIAEKVHEQLRETNTDYRDLHGMLGDDPLKVTVLSKGTHLRYTEVKKKEGADLAHLKPVHMNPLEPVIEQLLRCSKG